MTAGGRLRTPGPAFPTLLVVLALSLAVAACDIATSDQPPTGSPPSSGAAPSVTFEVPSFAVTEPKSPVAGVVTSIDSQGLDKVKGFTLRTRSGMDLTFVIGQLDNAVEFPPAHLAEHQASLQPVLVYFNVQGGKLVVFHLEDAA